MREIYHGVMLGVSTLAGLLMMFMGTVWMLQGLHIAFLVGFMVGRWEWVLFGAILALLGLSQIVWTHTRASYYRGK